MGKPKRKRAAKVENVVSPSKGVAQVRNSVRHLPKLPKLTLEHVKARHSSRPKNVTLGEAAASIPSDLSPDDFVFLHQLSREPSSCSKPTTISKTVVEESFCETVVSELPPNIEFALPTSIPDSCPPSPIITDLVPDSDIV